jgi:hypothetical protein
MGLPYLLSTSFNCPEEKRRATMGNMQKGIICEALPTWSP